MIEFCWCRHMWTKLNLRGHTSSIFAAGKQCGISLPINICMIVSYLFACSIYLWPIWQEIEVLRTSLPSIKGLRLFNPLYHSMGLFGKYHNTLFVPPEFCINILSSFSWDLQWSQEKTKTMQMRNLGGQTKSIMVFTEMAYNHCRCIYSYLAIVLGYLCGVFIYDGIDGQIICLLAFFFSWSNYNTLRNSCCWCSSVSVSFFC